LKMVRTRQLEMTKLHYKSNKNNDWGVRPQTIVRLQQEVWKIKPGMVGWHAMVRQRVKDNGQYDFEHSGIQYTIKVSTIPEGGLGLFANETLSAHQCLATNWSEYGCTNTMTHGSSEEEHDKHVESIKGAHAHGDYLMHTPIVGNCGTFSSTLADPFDYPFGFANDPRDKNRANHEVSHDGVVFTIKAVEKDDELFVNYGEEYPWQDAKGMGEFDESQLGTTGWCMFGNEEGDDGDDDAMNPVFYIKIKNEEIEGKELMDYLLNSLADVKMFNTIWEPISSAPLAGLHQTKREA